MYSIIDYKSGNIQSISGALEELGVEYNIISTPNEIEKANRIILPGAGSFNRAMDYMSKSGIEDAIKASNQRGAQILGICLGMQLLFSSSEENGYSKGLGFLEGDIKDMQSLSTAEVEVPHIGWAKLEYAQGPEYHGEHKKSYYYFVHSFMATNCEKENIVAYANYCDLAIPAIVSSENIIGFQFHPEKSGKDGLELLRSYLTQ